MGDMCFVWFIFGILWTFVFWRAVQSGLDWSIVLFLLFSCFICLYGFYCSVFIHVWLLLYNGSMIIAHIFCFSCILIVIKGRPVQDLFFYSQLVLLIYLGGFCFLRFYVSIFIYGIFNNIFWGGGWGEENLNKSPLKIVTFFMINQDKERKFAG